jgi:hypothetical protein
MGPEKLKAMERWNLILGAVFTLVASIFWPSDVALGVALGATLSAANFYAIRRIWQSLLSGSVEKRQGMQALFVLKTMALVVLVFVVVRYLPIDPAGFAVGISIFLLSIGIESARFVLRHDSPPATTDIPRPKAP